MSSTLNKLIILSLYQIRITCVTIIFETDVTKLCAMCCSRLLNAMYILFVVPQLHYEIIHFKHAHIDVELVLE